MKHIQFSWWSVKDTEKLKLLSMLIQHGRGAKLLLAHRARKRSFGRMDTHVIVVILFQIEFLLTDFARVVLDFQMNHFDVRASGVPRRHQLVAFGAKYLVVLVAQIFLDVGGGSILRPLSFPYLFHIDRLSGIAVAFLHMILVPNDRIEECVAFVACVRFTVRGLLVIIELPALIERFLTIGAFEY